MNKEIEQFKTKTESIDVVLLACMVETQAALYENRPYTLRIVKPAVDHSAATRLLCSTLRDLPVHAPTSFRCETCDRSFGSEKALRQPVEGIGSPTGCRHSSKPLFPLFPNLSITFLYHQLHRMPTCENTKVGGAVMPHQTVLGVDIKMR